MKKTAVVFLVTLTVLAAGVLAVSCNSAVCEELGTVVLDFGGGSDRALGSDALPVLSTVRIKAEVTSSAGRTVQEYEAGNQGNISLSLPVGERVVIKVSAYNPSGIWSGSVMHTVEPGTNAVGIKLKKNVSGLNNLLFTQTGDGQHSCNLTLYMDGKTFNASQGRKGHSFARDSKGRVYVLYKDASNSFHIDRYTSEGNGPESIPTPPAPPITPSAFMNDFTRGVPYIVSSSGAVHKIEGSSVVSSPLTTLLNFKGASAIDNNRVVWIPSGGSHIKICAKDLTSSAAPEEIEIENDIKIHNCASRDLRDLFIRGGYVYVLFTALNESITSTSGINLYSLGGVVRYNINNLTAPPVKIGFSNSVSFENGVLKNYDYSKNFYGAVKVIGFDDENIYIADDGFDAADTPAGARIVKNRNRIAALNMETNEVRFTETGSAKWYNEWKERRTPDTKTVVWKPLGDSGPAQKMMNYYQVERGDEDLSSAHPFITSSSSPSGIAYSDVFCYDSSGNFYVSGKVGSNEKLYRYVLKDDGSYENGEEKDISEKPKTMAVSVSPVLDDAGKTILFYYFESGHGHYIGRLAWYTDDFANAAQRRNITLNDLGQNDTVTAMAVNKDGIFVAVKTVTDKDTHNEKYKITVKKYAHQPLGSPASIQAVGSVTVRSQMPANWVYSTTAAGANKYTTEELNALYIQDGVLYGLITKRIGVRLGQAPDKSVITGEFLKIGNSGSLTDGTASIIYSSGNLTSVDDANASAISGTFSPYRFIAVKPKKLVIASDGYYAPSNNEAHMQQRNKVYIYDISKNIMEPGLDAKAEFSKKITSAFSW